jgi:hypothetical protein
MDGYKIASQYIGGRWFYTGVFAGERALVSTTIVDPDAAYSERGIYM